MIVTIVDGVIQSLTRGEVDAPRAGTGASDIRVQLPLGRLAAGARKSGRSRVPITHRGGRVCRTRLARAGGSRKYADSWSSASDDLRQKISACQWQMAVAGVRAPLGALSSRTLQSATPRNSLPGRPTGSTSYPGSPRSYAPRRPRLKPSRR